MTTASNAPFVPLRDRRFLHLLCALFLCAWVGSAIHPEMVADWILENLLVFALIGFLIATYRWLPLSDASYLSLFLFLCLHEWGAHYKYADVPLGEWMKVWLHTTRNHYDRVVHFGFGLFLSYPQRELLIRKAKVGVTWAAAISAWLSLAFSAAYEIIEAIVANIVSPTAGDAFLGLQGDPWDTQEDMFLGFLGSILAMVAVSVGRRLMRHRVDNVVHANAHAQR